LVYRRSCRTRWPRRTRSSARPTGWHRSKPPPPPPPPSGYTTHDTHDTTRAGASL
jgi:hypothetical protein